jgi:hypothetical protein
VTLAWGSCASTTALSWATLSHSPSPAAPPPALAIDSMELRAVGERIGGGEERVGLVEGGGLAIEG